MKTKLQRTTVIIQEDFPKEIVLRRKILFPIMFAARKLNIHAVVNADKLRITSEETDGNVTSHHRLPAALDPNFATTEKTENVLAFFGALCPLSNFHPSTFKCEGKTFRFMEEYFFYKKENLVGT